MATQTRTPTPKSKQEPELEGYLKLTNAEYYQQISIIGASIRAKVILAFCSKTNENVAIKKINLETVEGDAQWDNLTKETKLLSQMKHENIVNSHCSFQVINEGCPELWIVMPVMAGSCQGIIKNWRTNGIKDEHVLAFILRDTLMGLQYLHENNYIHRDVKASNVLMSINGVAKLSDFALTSIPKDDRKIVKKSLTGTPCWIAPEVWKGMYDKKADIWSFGILSMELAFGRPPFAHLDRHKLMQIALDEGPYPSMHDIYGEEVDHFSKAFVNMVTKCLNKVPIDRPSSTELLKGKFFSKASDRAYVQRVVKPMLNARNDAEGKMHLMPKSMIVTSGDDEKQVQQPSPAVGPFQFDFENENTKSGEHENTKSGEHENTKSGEHEIPENGELEKPKIDVSERRSSAASTSSNPSIDGETPENNSQTSNIDIDASVSTGDAIRKPSDSPEPLGAKSTTKKDHELQRSSSPKELDAQSTQKRGDNNILKNPRYEEAERWQIEPVSKWELDDVAAWLPSLGTDYEQYANHFKSSGVDGEMLLDISDEMLEEIHVKKVIHRKKIMKSIIKLKSS